MHISCESFPYYTASLQVIQNSETGGPRYISDAYELEGFELPVSRAAEAFFGNGEGALSLSLEKALHERVNSGGAQPPFVSSKN